MCAYTRTRSHAWMYIYIHTDRYVIHTYTQSRMSYMSTRTLLKDGLQGQIMRKGTLLCVAMCQKLRRRNTAVPRAASSYLPARCLCILHTCSICTYLCALHLYTLPTIVYYANICVHISVYLDIYLYTCVCIYICII